VPHISLVFGEMWEMNLLSRVDPPGFIHLGLERSDLRCTRIFPGQDLQMEQVRCRLKARGHS
jgi:hypothetical protein